MSPPAARVWWFPVDLPPPPRVSRFWNRAAMPPMRAPLRLLALSVTFVGAFCVGGEVPILVYSADKKNVKLLEGTGRSASRSQGDSVVHGARDSRNGDVKAAAVPGTVDAIVTLLKLYGTKSFEEVVQPTLAILDAGGPTSYIDTGNDKTIETGVHWQADMAVTFRKWWSRKKLLRAAATRNCKRFRIVSIAAISPTPWKPGTRKRAASFARRIWPLTKLPSWILSSYQLPGLRRLQSRVR